MRPSNFTAPRILVVGDIMLDRYIIGRSERLSPEAPVPVVNIQREHASLGGAGNVVQNLLAFGAQVTLLSAVGRDREGDELQELLTACGASTEQLVTVPDRPTTCKTRVLVQNHQIARLDRETCQPLGARVEAQMLRRIEEATQSFDALLISDYAKGVVTSDFSQALIRWARQREIPVLVDPKGANAVKYQHATLLTPNRKEAAQLAGKPIADEASLRQVGEELRQSLGLQQLVITLSEEGLALFDGTFLRLPTTAREVYDVSGAGDTVLAALGYGLACGWPLLDAAKLANDAAAVVVGKVGAAVARWDEIQRHRTREGLPEQRGVVASLSDLEVLVRHHQSRGKRVVFTNGCFDLLHRGHVEYLTASKQCGDLLVVGINSDQSVRRLKGESRPILSLADRSAIVAALQAVDYVVGFDEDTPYEVIRRLRPDVLTKGADYTREQVVGADLVPDVRLIPLVDGRSTTRTVQRIQAA